MSPRTKTPNGCRLLFPWLLVSALLGANDASGATFAVTNTSDTGAGSFRQALLDANAFPGTDTITFAIPGSGTRTITPATALPPVLEAVVIDGGTQPGFAGQPLIELNGSNAGSTAGLRILSGGSTVRALTINRFAGSAIQIEGPGTNFIQGNRLGTDPSGALARPNGLEGIWIYNSSGNQIGGAGSSVGNVISGNSDSGIYLQNGSGNSVKGNLVGVTSAGTAPLANGNNGITLYNAAGNFIGGSTAAERNVLSGNTASGIYFNGNGSTGNCVRGNYIGTGKGGGGMISNGADGITANGAGGNWIGGSNPGEGNLISGNGKAGIALTGLAAMSNRIEGNLIGTDSTGRLALGNTYAGISIAGAISNLVGGPIPGARNVISGNRQDGVFICTNSMGNTIAGNYIGVDITGTCALSNLFNGISISFANSNVVGGKMPGERNTISGNAIYGIELAFGASGNLVLGNLIGPSASGTQSVPNGRSGVRIESSNNTIGDLNAANVLSGNRLDGVVLVGPGASNNTVIANLIGTTPDGTVALPNGRAGVGISGAGNNVIGGLTAGEGNLLSGNAEAGIYLIDATATGNQILGNRIGTDAGGTKPLGNGLEGVYLENAPGNTIGGTLPASGNVISANRTRGLFLTNACWNLIAGNFIGTSQDGAAALGNTFHNIELEAGSTNNTIGGPASAANIIAYAKTIYAGVRIRDRSLNNRISGNAIFANGGLGIDLGPVGIDGNDACDADAGANNLQNFPALSQVVTGAQDIAIRGTLNSTAGQTYQLQFFACPDSESAGRGAGRVFVGETSVTLNSSCDQTFAATFSASVPVGYVITSTATDPAGNTSEFSNSAKAGAAPTLALQAAANRQVTLMWPDSPPGFVLKQTDSLIPPVLWTTVTNRVQLSNGVCQSTVSAVSGNRFFSLCWE